MDGSRDNLIVGVSATLLSTDKSRHEYGYHGNVEWPPLLMAVTSVMSIIGERNSLWGSVIDRLRLVVSPDITGTLEMRQLDK